MHEVAIAESVLNSVLRHADGRRAARPRENEMHVKKIRVVEDALDANMVRSALPSLPLEENNLLIVARVMASAVTEGEDKPLKYPA